jgi:hypothetical protein
MTNRETFTRVLSAQYTRLFETPDYALARARYSPDALAEKMTSGLVDGTANKDGEGILLTCKHLKLKPTYKAIREYLSA